MPDDDPDQEQHDPELAAERRHLRRSRARLASMRSRVEDLRATGGDPLSTEFLKASLRRRVRALEDDPEVPLFFGRLDREGTGASGGMRADDRLYIGRRHVTDDAGDPMVIDWRAPMSRAFYRASRQDAMGVVLRRRFGFVRGGLTAYEDEHLASGVPGASDGTGHEASRILRAEIERPRAGPMRDIVATIQPEQDDIVRGDLATSVCVQGAPGTGKTAVGLHRAAYLLYGFRDQLTRQGVLVVGPNASFLRYIADVLPALGEIDAAQCTVQQLTAHVPVRDVDSAAVAAVKCDPAMAHVVDAACWAHLTPQRDPLVVARGSRRWRVPSYQIEDIVGELRARGVRYGAGRAMLAQRIAHAVLVQMESAGDSPDDRVQDSVARSRPVKAYVDAWWPRLDPARLVHRLFSDAAFLSHAAVGVLGAPEQSLLLWGRAPRSVRTAPWTEHDAVLVDEAADRIERTGSVGHVVLDEAQDLSAMMLRAVARRSSTGSVTVLGDLAQATTPWGSRTWSSALLHLGKPDTHVVELTQGFRVPADVLEYAARLLPQIAPTLRPPTSVRQGGTGALEVRRCAPLHELVPTTQSLRRRPGTTGVIVADHEVRRVADALRTVPFTMLGDDSDMSAALDLVPATLAKGLEFDHVVLFEPTAIVDAEADESTGLRRLYVCMTRAVTTLVVLHRNDLPPALRQPDHGP